MKVLFCICLLLALGHGVRKTFNGDKVFRLTPSTEQEIEQLKSLVEEFELDLWKDARFVGDTVDIRVPFIRQAQFKVFLATSGVNHEIFIDDVQNLIDEQTKPRPAPRDLASFDYEVYHTFDEIQQWVDDFAAAYPDLATKDVVGTSYEGRTFNALTMSGGAGNPQFVINCGIHAREWVTPATCMYSAKFLADGYGSDAEITQLLDNVDFVFIPSSNPDGYAYTWSNDRMWRKTRTRGNGVCVGVDPNRNWDANHCGSGSSTSPCSDTYCGPSAFSEPCTLAQKNFVESLADPRMYVDVHSYSQMWMFPYGYQYDLSADHDTMDKIAVDSVAAIRSVHGKIYEPGPIATVIYVASGSTADYFYDKTSMKCTFATELRDTGRYGFILPENQIKPTAEESFAAFKVMAQAIVDGDCN